MTATRPKLFDAFEVGVKRSRIRQPNPVKSACEEKQEQLIAAWRKYWQCPIPAQDRLLTVLDPLVIAAVGRANRARLDYSLCQDAMQEVRLELVPQGFLLSSARLQALSRAPEEQGWPDAIGEQIFRTLTNLIYMVAQREVSSLVRSEVRHQIRNRASESLDHEECEHFKLLLERETFCQNTLHQVLRKRGYSAEKCDLIADYFSGHLNQVELGRKLGIKQPAISKRLRAIRRALTRLERSRGEGSLPVSPQF